MALLPAPLMRWIFLRLGLVLACTSIAATPCLAVKPQDVTAGELALLPPYCIDTEAFIYGHEYSLNKSPRADGWVAQMGRSFWTMHHYCWGLVNLNRLRSGRANTPNRKYFAKQIVDEYLFVIHNAKSDFVLLPEVWTRIGEASLLAGEVAQALEAYAMARSIKPDYWPAYSQWAEFLAGIGKKADAAALVRSGLAHSPDATPLVALYRRLGGDPSTIPRAASVPASAASAASASGATEPAASAATRPIQ